MLAGYIAVFVAAMMVDITPLPLPPAFTVMILLQIVFHLSIWPVIFTGVAGSILGRFILTLYIPGFSNKIFNSAKNEDIRFLGDKIKVGKWKGQAFILFYTLLPLPSTPLFLAAGIARLKPLYIIPAFLIGKFSSDSAAVFLGKYAAANIDDIMRGLVSWKSAAGLLLGLSFLFALLFIDWRMLIMDHKLKLRFNIWK